MTSKMKLMAKLMKLKTVNFSHLCRKCFSKNHSNKLFFSYCSLFEDSFSIIFLIEFLGISLPFCL